MLKTRPEWSTFDLHTCQIVVVCLYAHFIHCVFKFTQKAPRGFFTSLSVFARLLSQMTQPNDSGEFKQINVPDINLQGEFKGKCCEFCKFWFFSKNWSRVTDVWVAHRMTWVYARSSKEVFNLTTFCELSRKLNQMVLMYL